MYAYKINIIKNFKASSNAFRLNTKTKKTILSYDLQPKHKNNISYLFSFF